MTLSIKAFGSNTSLYNNEKGRVAAIGELSPLSRGTYSRHIHEYSEDPYPGILLSIFSVRDEQSVEQPSVLPNYSTRLVEIIAWCYNRGHVSNQTVTTQDFLVALENQFSGVVYGLSGTAMVTGVGCRVPGSLSFKLEPDSQEPVNVTLWLSDEEFKANYDIYEYVVAHPLGNLNLLVGSLAAMSSALYSPEMLMNVLEEAKGEIQATRNISHTVRWYDPQDPSKFKDITWMIGVHGPRGYTTDGINAEIRRLLLTATTIQESVWRVVLPDLFRVTRFFVVPNWTAKAIPERTSIAGIYSPMIRPNKIRDLMFEAFESTNDAANVDRLEYLVHPFRSIGVVLLAGLDNRIGSQSIQEIIPDYIGQETLGEDFNRQSETTKQWVTSFGIGLRLAEQFATGVTMPIGYEIVRYDNRTTVRFKIDGVEYIILTRQGV